MFQGFRSIAIFTNPSSFNSHYIAYYVSHGFQHTVRYTTVLHVTHHVIFLRISLFSALRHSITLTTFHVTYYIKFHRDCTIPCHTQSMIVLHVIYYIYTFHRDFTIQCHTRRWFVPPHRQIVFRSSPTNAPCKPQDELHQNCQTFYWWNLQWGCMVITDRRFGRIFSFSFYSCFVFYRINSYKFRHRCFDAFINICSLTNWMIWKYWKCYQWYSLYKVYRVLGHVFLRLATFRENLLSSSGKVEDVFPTII